MRVLMIGPYPPRIGGISTHVQRMVSFLQNRGHDVKVLDYLGSPTGVPSEVITLPSNLLLKALSLIRIAASTPSDTVVHMHIAVMTLFKWVAPLLLLLFWRQPKILSLHAGALVDEIGHPWQRGYVRWITGRYDRIVAVSASLAGAIAELGIPQERIAVIPAFIPAKPDKDMIPEEIRTIAGTRILIVTSGAISSVYDHDVLIDCIEQLPSEKYAFVFAFYAQPNPECERRIKNRLMKLDNVFAYNGLSPEQFSVCDIYVRTSTVDGDCVAIREAESLGLTVFASDSVWRPEFCQLFPLENSRALLDLFLRYKPPTEPIRHEITDEHSNAAKLYRIYQDLTADS